MSPEYSPLCDTDLSAYLAYLAANLKHGPGVVSDHEKHFTEGDGEAGGGCGDDGGCVSGDNCCVNFLREAKEVAVVLGGIVVGSGRGVDCDVGDCRERGSRSVAGIPCAIAGGGVNSLGDSDCDEHGDGHQQSWGPLLLKCGVVEKLEKEEKEKEKNFSGDAEVEGKSGCANRDGSKSGVEVSVEPSGCEGVSGIAEKTLRNRQWRMERKHRKQKRKAMGSDWRRGKDAVVESRGVFSECDKVVRLELLNSRAARYRAQNELEILKAKREIQVLEANDIESEVKRYRTKVSSQVEKNMVAIEKTHATLIATGNVPGFAETVVDGVPSLTSGSISPDSSASQAEFRAAQKKILDMEAEAARMLAAFKKLGISYEAALAIDKQTFTDDTRGNELYEELHPEADAAAIHYKYVDGKKKFSLGLDPDGFC